MMKHSSFGIATVLIKHVKSLVGCSLNPRQHLSCSCTRSMPCSKPNALDTRERRNNSPGSRICKSISSKSLIFIKLILGDFYFFNDYVSLIFHPIRLSFYSFIVNDFPQYPYLICQLVRSVGLRGKWGRQLLLFRNPLCVGHSIIVFLLYTYIMVG